MRSLALACRMALPRMRSWHRHSNPYAHLVFYTWNVNAHTLTEEDAQAWISPAVVPAEDSGGADFFFFAFQEMLTLNASHTLQQFGLTAPWSKAKQRVRGTVHVLHAALQSIHPGDTFEQIGTTVHMVGLELVAFQRVRAGQQRI
eukprot:5179910-Prymnesium_polylepis.1